MDNVFSCVYPVAPRHTDAADNASGTAAQQNIRQHYAIVLFGKLDGLLDLYGLLTGLSTTTHTDATSDISMTAKSKRMVVKDFRCTILRFYFTLVILGFILFVTTLLVNTGNIPPVDIPSRGVLALTSQTTELDFT